MTRDPFDDLERQLRGRVAASRAPRRAWWRSPRLAGLLAVAGLGVTGAAFAAGGLRGPGDEQRGRSLAWAVIKDSARQPACVMPRWLKDGPIDLIDAATPPAVLRALPWMREPAPAAELTRALEIIDSTHPIAGTRVVRSTVRLVRLDARWEVLVSLERGDGGFEVRDPATCQTLRREALERRIASEGPGVQEWARRRLATDTTANPDATMLRFTLISRGRPSMGTGITLLPGPGSGLRYDVPHGLLMSGPRPMTMARPPGGRRPASGGRRSANAVRTTAYTGLADPGIVRLRIWAKRDDTRRRLPRTVAVHRGFWRLELPAATGPVRLTEEHADGRTGRVVRLRGR